MAKPDTRVSSFQEERAKVAADRAGADLQLWHAWNANGRTQEHLAPLLQRYEPLLNRKVNEWKAPSVAPAAFKAELVNHFIGAASTFDPSRGVAFNTHLQTRLRKAQRYNAQHQNIGYIPEDMARHIGPYTRAHNELTEELGRGPTHKEVAERMGLPTAKVTKLVGMMRKDVPASHFETDPTAVSASRELDVVRLMQRRPAEYLTPDEVTVFNHIYGVNGARKISDTTTLASTLKLSQPKISRLKTSIAEKIRSYT